MTIENIVSSDFGMSVVKSVFDCRLSDENIVGRFVSLARGATIRLSGQLFRFFHIKVSRMKSYSICTYFESM